MYVLRACEPSINELSLNLTYSCCESRVRVGKYTKVRIRYELSSLDSRKKGIVFSIYHHICAKHWWFIRTSSEPTAHSNVSNGEMHLWWCISEVTDNMVVRSLSSVRNNKNWVRTALVCSIHDTVDGSFRDWCGDTIETSRTHLETGALGCT
jgi:hypothetical protein